MPQYEPWNENKTPSKPLLDSKGFDWIFYIIQMKITASMFDLSWDSDEEP